MTTPDIQSWLAQSPSNPIMLIVSLSLLAFLLARFGIAPTVSAALRKRL